MSDDLIEKIARAILETDPTCDYDACRHNYAYLPDGHLQKNLWESLHKSARAALSAIESSGTHAVVPVEPTYEMLAEADSAIPRFEAHDGHRMMGVDGAELCWNTMLSARPHLPETEGKG